MTNAYGRNSKVNLVKATGVEVFKQDTAYWKDQLRLDEFDFLENRALGPDEFQRLGNQRFLMMALQGDVRLETRMEQLRWAAMRNEFASGVTYNGVKSPLTMVSPAQEPLPLCGPRPPLQSR